MLGLSNWLIRVRIYCLVFFLDCSKIIPYSWDLKNAAVLIGKVGPANSNQYLQRTQNVLTSTMTAMGVTRELLQLLGGILNSAFGCVKPNVLLHGCYGQLRKPVPCLELQGGQRNTTQCFKDQPPCLRSSCAQGGKTYKWQRVLVLCTR